MKIHIKQAEIETALKDYITKLGINLEGQSVSIGFTNGRKNNGLTADIDITNSAAQAFVNAWKESAKTADGLPVVPAVDKAPEVAEAPEVYEEEEALQEEAPATATGNPVSLFG